MNLEILKDAFFSCHSNDIANRNLLLNEIAKVVTDKITL